jgi:hypothetical protein
LRPRSLKSRAAKIRHDRLRGDIRRDRQRRLTASRLDVLSKELCR